MITRFNPPVGGVVHSFFGPSLALSGSNMALILDISPCAQSYRCGCVTSTAAQKTPARYVWGCSGSGSHTASAYPPSFAQSRLGGSAIFFFMACRISKDAGLTGN